MGDSSERASGELTVVMLLIGLAVPVVLIGLGLFTFRSSSATLVPASVSVLPAVLPQDVPKLVEDTLRPFEFRVEDETLPPGIFPAQVSLDPGTLRDLLVEVRPRGAGMGLIFFRSPATTEKSKRSFVYVEHYGSVEPEIMERIAPGAVSDEAAAPESSGDLNHDILLAARMLDEELDLLGLWVARLERVVAGESYESPLLNAVVALGVMAPTGPHPTEVQVDLKVDGEVAYSALLDVAEWGGELRSVGIDTAFDQYSDPSTRSRRSAFAIAEQGSVVTVECADPRLKAYALLEVAEGWAK